MDEETQKSLENLRECNLILYRKIAALEEHVFRNEENAFGKQDDFRFLVCPDCKFAFRLRPGQKAEEFDGVIKFSHMLHAASCPGVPKE
jgi:hypothetical protein